LTNRCDHLDKLDSLIRSHSILRHPFYQAWQQGALTRGQLAVYATHYYPHVVAFPRYLEAAVAGAADPAIRSELTGNLHDELTTPKPHHEMWLDFAASVGADLARIDAAPSNASVETVRTFAALTEMSTAEAVAALYAYESQQPHVAREKASGLREHFGISSASALAYFDVHASIDVDHCQGERDALGRCLDAGASPEAMMTAAHEALRAYWKLLDGISEEAGLSIVSLPTVQ
jgi:pyrroloquinoline-quinone synthase